MDDKSIQLLAGFFAALLVRQRISPPTRAGCSPRRALKAPISGYLTQRGKWAPSFCGTTLMGPYCHACGQHGHESARSVSALLHDAWHIATHVDDRFWQTPYTLLLRPGVLTKEYCAERRARYLPPVRLYLVLSVLFFAFAAVSPHEVGAGFGAMVDDHEADGRRHDLPDRHRHHVAVDAVRQRTDGLTLGAGYA
jgi:hypothetical protein